ncbi:MAG: DNA-binding protein [Candidatus Omnitrophica bacterium]|nr:DNA-binding protein [Candidatus Omnitrophota bacterium]
MKILKKVLIGVLIVVVVLALGKDIIIKTAVETGVSATTGLGLNIKKFKLGMMKSLVDIGDLRMYNPRGFEDKLMLDMPEIYVDYEVTPLFKGKVHLKKISINMSEFVVVKNKNGDVNINSIKTVKAVEKKKAEPKKKKKAEPAKKGKAPRIQIDELNLKVGKVVYKDYSAGGDPKVQEFKIDLDETYNNITDPATLVNLIIVKALARTSIARLTNFDIGALQGSVADSMAAAQKLAEERLAAAQALIGDKTKALSQAGGQAKQAASDASDTVKKAADDLKDTFKMPFGKK